MERHPVTRYEIVFDTLRRTFLVRRRVWGLFWKAVFRSEVYFCALAFKKELERPRWAS
jgi:hypothetical protein